MRRLLVLAAVLAACRARRPEPTNALASQQIDAAIPETSAPAEPVAIIAPSEGVGLAPGPEGHLGAWLALGPFRLDDKKDPATFKPQGLADDRALRPRYGATEATARIDAPKRDDKADRSDAHKLRIVLAATVIDQASRKHRKVLTTTRWT